MDQGRVSVSYAKALFDWANETNQIDSVYKQSEMLIELITNNASFYKLLHTPMVSISRKSESINRVLVECCPLLTKFVLLMVKNGKEKLLANALLNLNQLYRKKNHITRTTVESAISLNEATKKQFISFFEEKFGGTIEFEHLENPDLIGGFVVTIDDKRIDKSVKGEIEAIRRKLVGNEK